MKTVITSSGKLIKMTPAMLKYQSIIENGSIEERELISLNISYNSNESNKAFIDDAMTGRELELEWGHTSKGLEFIKTRLRFTPTGRKRKRNPFGAYEETILDNFSHFTFSGFHLVHTCAGSGTKYYYRVYTVYAKTGEFFKYCYWGGQTTILPLSGDEIAKCVTLKLITN